MNKKASHYFIIALFCGLTAIFFYFSTAHYWQPAQYPVIIAVSKTPLSTPFYVAEAIHAFDDTCVSVTFEQVLGGQMAFAKVISGEVDFGTSSDSVIAFKALENKSFVTHGVFVQSDNDVKLVTRQTDNIVSAFELKGKKIGVTKGTASEYFLSTLLAIEGLTTADVALYHYKPEQLINGFIAGEVDAVVPWEPFAFQIAQALGQKIKIHDTKNLSTLSFNLISQNADSLLVEKTKCVIEGLNHAINYIASNPKEAKQIVMTELGLAPAFIDWVWRDYIFKLALNQALILSIKSQATWAVDSQMSDFNDIPDFDRFVDSRALLQVDPGSVNISQ